MMRRCAKVHTDTGFAGWHDLLCGGGTPVLGRLLLLVSSSSTLVATAAATPPSPHTLPLRPQASESRMLQSLDGLWRVRLDPEGHGDHDAWWSEPLRNTTSAPVPATLNDVLNLGGYFGVVWCERNFFIPGGTGSGDNNLTAVSLYFESATANARVWVDGQQLGAHRGVGLPFGWQLDTTTLLQVSSAGAAAAAGHRLTVRLDGLRNWQDMPPGASTVSKYGEPMLLGGDAGYYYSTPGIDGSVWLSVIPSQHAIMDVATRWDGRRLHYNVTCDSTGCAEDTHVTLIAADDDGAVAASGAGPSGRLVPTNPRLWWPIGSPYGTPYLYTLHLRSGTDHYRIRVGLRTVSATNRSILVNGKPVLIHLSVHLYT
jgi:beta-glucuronidase